MNRCIDYHNTLVETDKAYKMLLGKKLPVMMDFGAQLRPVVKIVEKYDGFLKLAAKKVPQLEGLSVFKKRRIEYGTHEYLSLAINKMAGILSNGTAQIWLRQNGITIKTILDDIDILSKAQKTRERLIIQHPEAVAAETERHEALLHLIDKIEHLETVSRIAFVDDEEMLKTLGIPFLVIVLGNGYIVIIIKMVKDSSITLIPDEDRGTVIPPTGL